MKKVALELRHRADADEEIQTSIAAFESRLKNTPDPWNLDCDSPLRVPEIGDGLEAQVDLSGALRAPATSGYAAFVLRNSSYLRDDSEFDDRLILNYEISEDTYRDLVFLAFPRFVEAFRAYRGTIVLDEELALEDWDRIVLACQHGAGDIDGRSGVFRIGAVNFFDEELSRRAFGLQPSEMVLRLQEHTEHASLLSGGLFLVVTTSLLPRNQLERLDEAVRSHLK